MVEFGFLGIVGLLVVFLIGHGPVVVLEEWREQIARQQGREERTGYWEERKAS